LISFVSNIVRVSLCFEIFAHFFHNNMAKGEVRRNESGKVWSNLKCILYICNLFSAVLSLALIFIHSWCQSCSDAINIYGSSSSCHV
jgi:hypothetical protein